ERRTVDVEVVAAYAPQNPRKAPGDFAGVRLHGLPHGAIKASFKRLGIHLAAPILEGQWAEVGGMAIGQDCTQPANVIDRLAIDDGVRAGRVIADHAAEVGAARRGNVGPELQAVRGQGPVELIEHHTRLDTRRPPGRIDAEHLIDILAAIEHDTRTDGLSGETGAAAAGRYRNVHLGANLHRGVNVVHGLRDHDAERLDLIDAG